MDLSPLNFILLIIAHVFVIVNLLEKIVNFQFFNLYVKPDIPGENAFYDGANAIYVSASAEKGKIFRGLLGHEMFHKVFATEQDIKTLYNDALKNISKEKKQDIRKRYTEVYGKIVTDKEKIKRISDEEAAAAYSEEIFGEDGVWEYLLDEEPT